MLKPNGKIIYSTCTFSKVEDEDVCEWFTKNYEYKFVDCPKAVCNSTTFIQNPACRRFYPFLSDGEGQFVCVMQKIGGLTQEKRPYKQYKMGKSELDLINKYINDTFNINFAKKYAKIGGKYCVETEKLQNMLGFMQKLAIINAGVTVGEIEKGRLVPHHNMFTAFGNLAKQKLNLSIDDDNLEKYLHGEELSNASLKNGYAAVCVDSYAVGGAKVIDSRLKNMFPKGLRI